MPRYDKELLSTAKFLLDAGITTDQTTRLHHFSLKGRQETIWKTVRWIEKHIGSEIRATTVRDYYQRLEFLRDCLRVSSHPAGVPEEAIEEALRQFPLVRQAEIDSAARIKVAKVANAITAAAESSVITNWSNEFATVVSCSRCNPDSVRCIQRDAHNNVPQPGYIGRNYAQKRILLVGQNPGVGNPLLEERAEAYLAGLRQVRDNPTLEHYNRLVTATVALIPKWRIHDHYFPLKASDLTIDDIAYLNIVRCRTKKNQKPPSAMITNCLPHFETWITLLRPAAVVFLGKWASNKGSPILDRLGIAHQFINRARNFPDGERRGNMEDVAALLRSVTTTSH